MKLYLDCYMNNWDKADFEGKLEEIKRHVDITKEPDGSVVGAYYVVDDEGTEYTLDVEKHQILEAKDEPYREVNHIELAKLTKEILETRWGFDNLIIDRH